MAGRTWRVVGLLALVVVALGGGVAIGRATESAKTEDAKTEDQGGRAEYAADLIEPGRPWTIVVTGSERRALIGGLPDRVAPRGSFVAVSFELTNAGETALAFPFDELALTDEAGRVYPTDAEATRLLLLWERRTGPTTALAAGETRSVAVVFDVPAGAAGLTLIDAPGAGRVLSFPLEG